MEEVKGTRGIIALVTEGTTVPNSQEVPEPLQPMVEEVVRSSTFNVVDIFEYFLPVETEFNSRTSSFQEGETDVGRKK
jgi:hypothetical protein